MTNEEAIDIVKCLAYHDVRPSEEEISTAIAALKAEPCEDTISRKHLLSEIDVLMKSPWFNRWKDDGGALHFGYTERKEAVEIVRDLCVKEEPPVTPKPRTGHWIRTGAYYTGAYGSIDYVECSCCHEDSLEEGDYCPNCGAKMGGEKKCT